MVQLRFLGGAMVEGGSKVVTGLNSRRHPLAILALLATAPSRTLSRSKLVGLLWPKSPEEKGRNRLNTYIHQIRRELGSDVVASVGSDLRLDPTVVACDVCRFEEALEAGDPRRAVELYGGPFLDGFRLGGSAGFEHHVDRERARLGREYRQALEALAKGAEEGGDLRAAARWWRERANEDPYDSAVALRLMRTLGEAGNPAAALRVARAHTRLLKREFGTKPSDEVQALIRDLKTGAPLAPSSSPSLIWAPGAARATSRSPAPASHVPSPAAGAPTPSPLSPEPASTQSPLSPERAPSRWRQWRGSGRMTALATTALLGAGVAGSLYLLAARSSGPPRTDDRGIAVLPFENLGDQQTAVFTEGIHSDLSTRLGTLADLDVISRASVLRFRDSEKPLPEIARELGVRWVLRAEVQQVGDEIQVNARLLDATRNRPLWAESYLRELTAANLLEIQGEIARGIVEALKVRLVSEDTRRLQRAPTENLAAYELYLHARDLDRSSGGPPASERKVTLYRRALELDPSFAEAWARLADAYVERGWTTGDLAWMDSALAVARKALELDPESADAHAQIGDVYLTLGRTEEAIAEYERSLELQPSNWEATNNLTVLLAFRGRYAEKMRLLDRARQLSPDSPEFIGHLAILNARLGRDDVADAWLDHGREEGHSMPWARFHIALFYRQDIPGASKALEELEKSVDDYRITRRRAALALYAGNWIEARRHYRILYPGPVGGSAAVFSALLADPLGLAYALDRLGDRMEAHEIAREVIQATERELPATPDHMARHRMALAHLILGDTAKALGWLNEAVDVGYRDVRGMRTVPTLDPLRGHPEFQVLLERIEILVAEELRRVEAEGWGVPDRGAAAGKEDRGK